MTCGAVDRPVTPSKVLTEKDVPIDPVTTLPQE